MNAAVVREYFSNSKLKSEKEGEKNFSASCNHCPGRYISGSVSSSANFIKHLKVSLPLNYEY